MKKRKKKQNKDTEAVPVNKRTLHRLIVEVLVKNPTKALNYKQIAKKLEVTGVDERQLIITVLADLLTDKKIEEPETGKYRIKAVTGTFKGTLDMSQKGSAYVYTDEEVDNKIFIPRANLKSGLHGDTVEIYVYAMRKQAQPEGEVIRVIKRAKTDFVGVVQRSKNFAFLTVNHKYMPYDIFIPLAKLNGAKQGDKAIARVTEWPTGAKNPIGTIIDVLGKTGDNNAEMHAILAEFDLPYKFPDNIEAEANALPDIITDDEIARRRDFRKVPTLTIDPEDAKDFDDALSFATLANGNFEVGVHIADVTYYLRENTNLDDAAFQRATSVYLVDRVIPMLPEKLSNNVCSLRPNEDKLCYSAVFEIDANANVVKEWFGRTVIHSIRRFNYDEAQQVIETGEGDMKEELTTLHKLAQKLRKIRFKNGSISFERAEVKFKVDENGKPLSVYFKEPKDSNHLIEEFMLLANKKVAEFIGKASEGKVARTFVYRVHDEPDLEKLASFSRFIRKFGYTIQLDNEKNIASSLNNLLGEVKGKNEEDVIQTLAIRSMAKALYSTKNIGHYGLAFKHYTHFTSPIRRYPDVMVHRLLEHYLQGGRSANKQRYEKLCKHSSEMEQKAVFAERASVKYKQVEFMKDQIGSEYAGVISGITEWGMYVEIDENKIEGMVSIKDLDDDFYVFDEDSYCLKGHYKKRSFQLGDKVRIKIVRANLERKQLDFMLA